MQVIFLQIMSTSTCNIGYVDMQHWICQYATLDMSTCNIGYVNMQRKNVIRREFTNSQKLSNTYIARNFVTSGMLHVDSTYACPHATYLCWHTIYLSQHSTYLCSCRRFISLLWATRACMSCFVLKFYCFVEASYKRKWCLQDSLATEL
jgi:hypothetical protein